MIAELLGVGTELLLGEIVDTNSAWLAGDLSTRGVDVYWSQRVGDNEGRIIHAIQQALSRSDIVIMCGGLGPTDDDMSREAIAKVVGETPAVDGELEAALRARFATFSRHMPERNLKQAWLIPSAESLPNPLGTAPGWFVRTTVEGKDKFIIALPGPPRELERMWLKEAVPRLALPQAALYTKTFKTHGLGESGIAEKLGELTLASNPSVATYAKRDGVHVRVAAKAETLEEAFAIAKPVEEGVRALFTDILWGEDREDLPGVIVARLQAQGKTLAIMESLTGGMLSSVLTSVAGVSAVYPGGVVAYSVPVKAAFGVPQTVLETHGAVSQETAAAMAEAAAARFGADYGLAVTGVAGPDSSEGKEVGQVYFAVWRAEGCLTRSAKFPPLERDWIRERATFTALAYLDRVLSGKRQEASA